MKTNQLAVHATAQLPLVEVKNQQAVTTSLQIAQTFNKNHFDVLKAIKNLDCTSDFIASNFTAYHYHSKLNEHYTRKLPMYYITRDGFTFLVMGFTGKLAAKFKEDYITAFNSMEEKLREIQQKGLVSVKALQDQIKQTEYWRGQYEFWFDGYSRNVNSMLRITEMLVEARNELKAERNKKAAATTITA